jgi:hypothetical protein
MTSIASRGDLTLMCETGSDPYGPCRCSGAGVSLRRVARASCPWGWVVDMTAVSEAAAGLLAAGGVKELGEAAGGGLVVGMVARVRKVFGSDVRSVDALERARRDGGCTAVAELASALAWYAQRDAEFAREMVGWAAQVGAGGVRQRVHAGRDAYTAGRDQTMVNYWSAE